ncbi:MAG TPA: glycosyltransferase [Thermoanaerobaculia bacterium]|nr:glycosyltransferase [Thermoanaerobaculia bacterium]
MSRSRVLVVAPQPFYEDRGTPIAVCQLLRALSQLAYDVDILTFPVGQTIEIPRVHYVRVANPFGVRRVPIGFSLSKILLDLTLFPELARRLARGGYCCVHALEEAAFPAVALGHRFRVPVIYDMQSSLPEQLAKKHTVFRTLLAQAFLKRAERWLLRNADTIVSSAGLAQRVRTVAPRARLREWRYAAMLPAASQDEAETLRQDLGIAPGRPVVLYSGTFETYQGLPELLAAIPHVQAEVPDVVFVLVGAEESGGTTVERGHVGLIRNGTLRVVRRQPRERIPRFLALADVVVSPRAYGDNLPLKIFDYLAAGKPIVATDIPAHRAELDESRALLVQPWAPELASGIVRLLRDPTLAASLAAAGRAYAERRFGWFEFVRSVGDLYRELNGGNGG